MIAVGNSMLNEIRRLTSRETWRHCPGKENPADIPSRSCGALELVESNLWWNGPPFLQHDSDQWPDLVTNYEVEGANEELIKKSPAIIHSSTLHTRVIRNPSTWRKLFL